MESGDWRVQLQPGGRQRIVNKILEHLKQYCPDEDGLQALKVIAMRFEDKIYTTATSQSDYLRKISLKMLTMEARSESPMPDTTQASNGSNPLDPGSMVSGHQAPSISDIARDNVSSGGPEGDPSMESGDWRVQLETDSRKRIVNKILETLKRHLRLSDHADALQGLMGIAMRFEERIYTIATSQSDYLRKISLKMLSLEAISENPMPDAMQENNGLNPLDPEFRITLAAVNENEKKQLQRSSNACKRIPKVMHHAFPFNNQSPNVRAAAHTIAAEDPADLPKTIRAATTGQEEKNGGDSSSCVICLDAPVEGAFIPCGHMAGCMSCLIEIKGKKSRCPICRANVDQVIRLYAV